MSSPATSSVAAGLHRNEPTDTHVIDSLEVLTNFGASMLRAGHTAARTRECMELLGRKLGVDDLAVGMTLDSIVANGRRAARTATIVREIGPPGVNAARLGALENLAATASELGRAGQSDVAASLNKGVCELEGKPDGAKLGKSCGTSRAWWRGAGTGVGELRIDQCQSWRRW